MVDTPARRLEAEIRARFEGPAGIERLKQAYQVCIDCAAAQAPADEILATLLVECQLSAEDASLVFAFASEDIENAALAAKSRMRREITAACRQDNPSAARIGLMKEFAYQHLDWSRKPLDDETRDALKEADKIRRQGK